MLLTRILLIIIALVSLPKRKTFFLSINISLFMKMLNLLVVVLILLFVQEKICYKWQKCFHKDITREQSLAHVCHLHCDFFISSLYLLYILYLISYIVVELLETLNERDSNLFYLSTLMLFLFLSFTMKETL